MSAAKVLLADDHVVVRAGLRNALASLPDLEIAGEVGNGHELAEALTRLDPDLLVLDASMPISIPYRPSARSRERPGLKILIVSAHDDESYVVGLLDAGADGYHMKDQPLADLQLATRRILEGERWISSSLIAQAGASGPRRPSSNAIWLTRRQRSCSASLIQGASITGTSPNPLT